MAQYLTLALALIIGLSLPIQGVSARRDEPGIASANATLSILVGTVQRIPDGASEPEPAADGMNLAVGDRVLTGPDSRALVTFLDGSTVTVEPESDVAITMADVGGGDKGSNIRVQINAGTVWARVVRLLDPGSSFSLDSNTATASVHSGVIGGRQNPDGSFLSWTRAGELTVRGKQGQPMLTLQPGQATTVEPGQTPAPRVFSEHQSTLKVTASAGLLPLVQMPDGVRVAGFVSPGIEVNQVFGSETTLDPAGGRVVEVPAGQSGPFTLVFEGQRDGAFTLRVAGFFQGREVYQRELSVEVRKGERLATQVSQTVDPSTASDPRTARVLGGDIAPLLPLNGPLPGKTLLSPSELQAAGRATTTSS